MNDFQIKIDIFLLTIPFLKTAFLVAKIKKSGMV